MKGSYIKITAFGLAQVVLDARFENDFKENYKELKIAFERLKILKVRRVPHPASGRIKLRCIETLLTLELCCPSSVRALTVCRVTTQFLDRQRLMSSASPHAAILCWLYNRCRGRFRWPVYCPGLPCAVL